MTEQTQRDCTKLLLIDTCQADGDAIRALFSQARGSFELDWVSSYQDAAAAIAETRYDAYLLGQGATTHEALGALDAARKRGCRSPLIVLWASEDAAADDRSMRLGADDFLVKCDLTPQLLDRSVRYAIERAYTAERLHRMAQYDRLTELPNRDLFYERLEAAFCRSGRTGQTLGLLYVDLDGFKPINDTDGHAAGDRVLQVVAQRLASCVRGLDTVARLGGDEFAVIVENINSAENAAALGRRLVRAVSDPIDLPLSQARVSASVGVACTAGSDMTLDQLVISADTAMYRSKEAGGGDVTVYHPDMQRRSQGRRDAEAQLRLAFERDEFRLVYQPQIDLRTGAVVGAEALLRWHPEGEAPRSPAEFIPVLETMDLIDDVGEWVVETACREALRWHAAGHDDMSVSVNLSTRQFRSGDLADRIVGALARTGLPPHALEVEITETLVMEDVAMTEKTLARLRKMGVRVGIDDFGTGYSSLGYLKGFPIDTLKIDRVFVRDAVESPDAAAIIGTITSLGHELRHRVVVEGVETEEQFRLVRARRCDIVQGYFIARPMPPSEFSTWLSNHGAWSVEHADLFREQSGRARSANVPVVLADTVLVVDDEAPIRRVLSRILTRRGLRVLEARDVTEARDVMARERNLATVFTDIHLPDGSGLDLIAPADDPAAPAFIVMTGGAAVEDTVRAMRRGAVDFLTKPFEPADLGAALDRAQRHRAVASRLWEIETARDRLGLADGPADARWIQ